MTDLSPSAPGSSDILITVDVEAQAMQKIAELPNAIKSLISSLTRYENQTLNTINSQKALNQALGFGADGARVYAKNSLDAARNQETLNRRLKENSAQLIVLKTHYHNATLASNQYYRESLQNAKSLQSQASQVRLTQTIQDAQSLSRSFLNLGKNLQYVGRNLTIGITLPIVSLLRSGLDSFKRLEREIVRFEKIAGGAFQKESDFEKYANQLEKDLNKISRTYGTARELVQAVAADFAQIGITLENDPLLRGKEGYKSYIADLAKLSAEIEILGDTTMEQSRSFVQALLQQSLVVQRTVNETVDYGLAIEQVTTQLAMFNAVENNTVLSIESIAKAIPEMQAVTTQFGLTLDEATAAFAPMIAAGFEVGASANSIKVSLQRLVAPTKQNKEMIDMLRSSISGFNFDVETGIESVEELAKGFLAIQRSSKGTQGALEFFAKFFGVRQGSRMLQSLQELAYFNEELGRRGSQSARLAQAIVDEVNKSVASAGFNLTFQANSISALGKISRESANAYAQGNVELAKAIQEGQTTASKLFAESIDDVNTQAGKILLLSAAGPQAARKVYDEELAKYLESPVVKLAVARETFKEIQRELIPILVSTLETLLPAIKGIADFIKGLSPAAKQLIGLGLIGAAALGPLIAVFSNLAQVIGVTRQLFWGLIGTFSRMFGKSGILVSAEMFAGLDNLSVFGDKLSRISDNVFFFNGRMKTFEKTLKRAGQAAKGQAESFGFYEKGIFNLMKKRGNVIKSMTDPQVTDIEKLARVLSDLTGIENILVGSGIDPATAAIDRQTKRTRRKKQETEDLTRQIQILTDAEDDSSGAMDATIVPRPVAPSPTPAVKPTPAATPSSQMFDPGDGGPLIDMSKVDLREDKDVLLDNITKLDEEIKKQLREKVTIPSELTNINRTSEIIMNEVDRLVKSGVNFETAVNETVRETADRINTIAAARPPISPTPLINTSSIANASSETIEASAKAISDSVDIDIPKVDTTQVQKEVKEKAKGLNETYGKAIKERLSKKVKNVEFLESQDPRVIRKKIFEGIREARAGGASPKVAITQSINKVSKEINEAAKAAAKAAKAAEKAVELPKQVESVASPLPVSGYGSLYQKNIEAAQKVAKSAGKATEEALTPSPAVMKQIKAVERAILKSKAEAAKVAKKAAAAAAKEQAKVAKKAAAAAAKEQAKVAKKAAAAAAKEQAKAAELASKSFKEQIWAARRLTTESFAGLYKETTGKDILPDVLQNIDLAGGLDIPITRQDRIDEIVKAFRGGWLSFDEETGELVTKVGKEVSTITERLTNAGNEWKATLFKTVTGDDAFEDIVKARKRAAKRSQSAAKKAYGKGAKVSPFVALDQIKDIVEKEIKSVEEQISAIDEELKGVKGVKENSREMVEYENRAVSSDKEIVDLMARRNELISDAQKEVEEKTADIGKQIKDLDDILDSGKDPETGKRLTKNEISKIKKEITKLDQSVDDITRPIYAKLNKEGEDIQAKIKKRGGEVLSALPDDDGYKALLAEQSRLNDLQLRQLQLVEKQKRLLNNYSSDWGNEQLALARELRRFGSEESQDILKEAYGALGKGRGWGTVGDTKAYYYRLGRELLKLEGSDLEDFVAGKMNRLQAAIKNVRQASELYFDRFIPGVSTFEEVNAFLLRSGQRYNRRPSKYSSRIISESMKQEADLGVSKRSAAREPLIEAKIKKIGQEAFDELMERRRSGLRQAHAAMQYMKDLESVEDVNTTKKELKSKINKVSLPSNFLDGDINIMKKDLKTHLSERLTKKLKKIVSPVELDKVIEKGMLDIDDVFNKVLTQVVVNDPVNRFDVEQKKSLDAKKRILDQIQKMVESEVETVFGKLFVAHHPPISGGADDRINVGEYLMRELSKRMAPDQFAALDKNAIRRSLSDLTGVRANIMHALVTPGSKLEAELKSAIDMIGLPIRGEYGKIIEAEQDKVTKAILGASFNEGESLDLAIKGRSSEIFKGPMKDVDQAKARSVKAVSIFRQQIMKALKDAGVSTDELSEELKVARESVKKVTQEARDSLVTTHQAVKDIDPLGDVSTSTVTVASQIDNEADSAAAGVIVQGELIENDVKDVRDAWGDMSAAVAVALAQVEREINKTTATVVASTAAASLLDAPSLDNGNQVINKFVANSLGSLLISDGHDSLIDFFGLRLNQIINMEKFDERLNFEIKRMGDALGRKITGSEAFLIKESFMDSLIRGFQDENYNPMASLTSSLQMVGGRDYDPDLYRSSRVASPALIVSSVVDDALDSVTNVVDDIDNQVNGIERTLRDKFKIKRKIPLADIKARLADLIQQGLSPIDATDRVIKEFLNKTLPAVPRAVEDRVVAPLRKFNDVVDSVGTELTQAADATVDSAKQASHTAKGVIIPEYQSALAEATRQRKRAKRDADKVLKDGRITVFTRNRILKKASKQISKGIRDIFDVKIPLTAKQIALRTFPSTLTQLRGFASALGRGATAVARGTGVGGRAAFRGVRRGIGATGVDNAAKELALLIGRGSKASARIFWKGFFAPSIIKAASVGARTPSLIARGFFGNLSDREVLKSLREQIKLLVNPINIATASMSKFWGVVRNPFKSFIGLFLNAGKVFDKLGEARDKFGIKAASAANKQAKIERDSLKAFVSNEEKKRKIFLKNEDKRLKNLLKNNRITAADYVSGMFAATSQANRDVDQARQSRLDSMRDNRLTRRESAGRTVRGGLVSAGSAFGQVVTTPLKLLATFTALFLVIGKVVLIVAALSAVFAPIIAGIVAFAIAIRDLFKAFQQNEQIANRLKTAFKQIISFVKAIFKPVADAVASFFGFNEAGKDNAETYSRLAAIILDITEKIGAFLERLQNSEGFKNFQNSVQGGFVQLINVVILFGKIFKDLVTGNVDKAKSKFEELRMRLYYLFLGLLEEIIPILNEIVSFMISSFALAVKLSIRLFKELLPGVWEIAKGIGNIFWEMLKQIATGFTRLFNAIKGGEGKNAFERLGEFALGVAEIGIPGLGFVTGNIEFGAEASKAIEDGIDVSDAVSSGFETVDNVVGSIVQTANNGMAGLLDKLNTWITGKRDQLAADFREIFGTEITAPINLVAEGERSKLEEDANLIAAAVAQATKPDGEELGNDVANAVKEALKDAMQKFVDLVTDYLGNQIEKIKTKYTEMLEEQKDESLKYFDDQIAAIDALEQAEEKLLRKQEQIAEDRKRLRDRELELENYRRNRALAIYEGRVDDARVLDLEQKKSTIDFNEESQRITEDRAREAQREQRDIVKEILRRQKEDAQEAFDEIIKSYQDFIENIGQYGTYTQEELEQQFQEIHDKAVEASNGMLDAFTGFFNEIPNMISEYTDPTVGFFSIPLEQLIEEARDLFGLTMGDQARADTLLGVVNATMNQMGTVFTSGVQTATESTVGELGSMATSIEEALNNVIEQYITPSVEKMEEELEKFDPEGIMAAALEHANTTMLREYQTMVGHTASLVDGIASQLNPLIQMYASVEAAARSAAGATAGVSPGGGGGPGDSTGPVPINAPDRGRDIPINSGRWLDTYFRTAYTGVSADFRQSLRSGSQSLINSITGYFITNQSEQARNQILDFLYAGTGTDTLGLNVRNVVNSWLRQTYPGFNFVNRFNGGKISSLGYGGKMKMQYGGMAVPGFKSTAVPALLHGGEYVINSKAVSNIGMATLQSLNNMKFANFKKPSQGQYQTINTTNTTHIYVENFIGQDEWFQSMMKEYNVKVIPNNQKSAGLQSRAISTYNGINRGM